MNKRLLLLYPDNKEKDTLILCEEATKSVLRKFRKNAMFSYMQFDTSISCRDVMRAVLAEKAAQCDAILWHGKKETQFEESAFLAECLGIYAQQYFASGKCICSPLSFYTVKSGNSALIQESKTSFSNIRKAAKLAINTAGARKRSITLCTDSQSGADRLLFTEFENSLGGARHFDISHYDFDEMIFCSIREMPPCDVILAAQDKAHILAMHMSSLNKFPSGHIVWHGEDIRIYKRMFFPYEKMNNFAYASLLIACGSLLEEELGFKSAGLHLRRAAALALEKYAGAPRSEFHKQVLSEINTPLRNRQVIIHDSNN